MSEKKRKYLKYLENLYQICLKLIKVICLDLEKEWLLQKKRKTKNSYRKYRNGENGNEI